MNAIITDEHNIPGGTYHGQWEGCRVTFRVGSEPSDRVYNVNIGVRGSAPAVITVAEAGATATVTPL